MAQSNFSWKARIRSFGYAFNGLKIVWREEHNFRVHLLAAVLAIALSWALRISPYEWLAVVFSIGFVLVCELLNTALENLADFVCPEKNPNIKRIKDIAAAAVMLSSLTALLIGLLIFVPKLLSLAHMF
ncbi:diacylglycerol kinase [Sphingobacterium sp. CZ-UAM]|uniref:diacylglycerol kinase family protein n=1 Tax=unclassified Sphingobacterium TaxID=2609468 RepID=UPI00098730D5|nr:diacylglycerol kinase family protein [Sphingobacterium sp. CZ-UAM]OOG18689.1 diacylglycerol kinase [Sphingobacterium sp. CZ-UAM]